MTITRAPQIKTKPSVGEGGKKNKKITICKGDQAGGYGSEMIEEGPGPEKKFPTLIERNSFGKHEVKVGGGGGRRLHGPQGSYSVALWLHCFTNTHELTYGYTPIHCNFQTSKKVGPSHQKTLRDQFPSSNFIEELFSWKPFKPQNKTATIFHKRNLKNIEQKQKNTFQPK